MLDVGDTLVIRLEVKVDGVLTDASSIAIKVRSPSQIEATYPIGPNLVRDDVGIYRALIDCTEAGHWDFVWLSAGPIAKGAETGYFDVNATI